MSPRILWDAVPQAIKDELALRERPREGDTAIIDAAPGERWYFRRTAHGWNHVSTDKESKNDSIASDLTPAQRDEALRQVAEVEKRMLERMTTKSVGELRDLDMSATKPPTSKIGYKAGDLKKWTMLTPHPIRDYRRHLDVQSNPIGMPVDRLELTMPEPLRVSEGLELGAKVSVVYADGRGFAGVVTRVDMYCGGRNSSTVVIQA